MRKFRSEGSRTERTRLGHQVIAPADVAQLSDPGGWGVRKWGGAVLFARLFRSADPKSNGTQRMLLNFLTRAAGVSENGGAPSCSPGSLDRLTRKVTASVELGGGLTLIGHLRAISRSLREYLRKPERAAATYE